MNKIGGERVLYFYWFFIFVIVAVAMVVAVGLFYSNPADVRKVEAGLLGDKIVDCLIDGGEIKEFDKDLNFCNLNFEDSHYDDEQYYFLISIYNFDNLDEKILEIEEGNDFFRESCGLDKKRKLPQCSDKKVYALNKGGAVVVNILTAVRKSEQNL